MSSNGDNEESSDTISPSSSSSSSTSPNVVSPVSLAWKEVLSNIIRIRNSCGRKHKGLRSSIDESILMLQALVAEDKTLPKPPLNKVARHIVMSLNLLTVAKHPKLTEIGEKIKVMTVIRVIYILYILYIYFIYTLYIISFILSL